MIEMKLDKLLQEAIEHRVSDIHINTDRDRHELIGRRHKTLCYRYDYPDALKMHALCKHLACFDMSTFQAQTGIFKWVINDFEYLIRFSSMESYSHKNAVLRILNLHQIDSIHVSVSNMDERELILNLLRSPSGIVLFVGKTGSGKSTSMFNCLSALENQQVYTLENPIERFSDAWIQIDTKDFEGSLTQLLRHDPDIVVFGEVRSSHDIAQLVRAGLSGHKVVSTMHAGSIIQAIRRLCDLGASIYDLYDILEGIVFQTMSLREGKVVIEYEIKTQKDIQRLLDAFKDEKRL